ncbi:hypothetical protein AAFF_G00101640 [Aldrovandia affinis]|uniref:Reverse transcriptase n=1 Tax=Aldrovandia affinis TaxID=143900 RepID=A0AAD7RUT3_9TELE|nr:hypothetical protein AAFF_G00101640 [Aldrovandia affinis]
MRRPPSDSKRDGCPWLNGRKRRPRSVRWQLQASHNPPAAPGSPLLCCSTKDGENDILVHAANYTVALTNLRTVFELIAKANLRRNPVKCHLFCRQINFVVSKRGVSTNPVKVEAVEKLPSPTSTGKVRSFLGLASYYRKLIAGFCQHQPAPAPAH